MDGSVWISLARFDVIWDWQPGTGLLPQGADQGYNRCIEHLRVTSRTTIAMMMPPNHVPKRSTFRADLVARVRQEIAEGSYDTPEKLEAALERLFDCLSRRSCNHGTDARARRKPSGDIEQV